MSLVDRLRNIRVLSRGTRRSELRGEVTNVHGIQPFMQTDEKSLLAEYVKDVEEIGPNTPIEEAQRRIFNLTHIHEIVAQIQSSAKNKPGRS